MHFKWLGRLIITHANNYCKSPIGMGGYSEDIIQLAPCNLILSLIVRLLSRDRDYNNISVTIVFY